MGIAVGILMGSQALGAALGGVAANVVGAPRAIAGSLALAALFGVWALLTSPYEPKHLAGRPRRDRTFEEEAVADDVVIDLRDPKPEPVTIEYQVAFRSEEHTSELQSLMRISYAVF